MTYTISQAAQRFGLEPHTLRYYEKEGILAPEREPGGARRYSEEDLGRLEMALCLKGTGMALKDIRRYFELVAAGDGTLDQRLAIFREQRERVRQEIGVLTGYLEKLEHKIGWIEGLAAQDRQK